MATLSETIPALGSDLGIDRGFFGTNLRRAFLESTPAASSGGTVPTGTSFPTAPVAGEMFFRTDESKFYAFDGSDWREVPMLDTSGNLAIGGRYLKE